MGSSVSERATSRDVEAFLARVRDGLLGRTHPDIDFAVVGSGSGIRLARAVARALGAAEPVVYRQFGTAMVSYQGIQLEFVGTRRESYRASSRKPLVEEGTLEDDLRRRDFTINALAVRLGASGGELIDLFGGLEDLRRGLIRTPLDPVRTFYDDPLRMIRAIRLAVQLEFTIDPAALEGIRLERERIQIVSMERITEELQKLLLTRRPGQGFALLHETGLLELLLPELAALEGVETVSGYGHKDNLRHTLQVLDQVAALSEELPQERRLWLRWAALLHDVGKAPTKRFVPGEGWTFHGHDEVGARMVPAIFRRLRLPMDERMRRVQKLVRLHLRPIALSSQPITDSAVRRLILEAGEDLEDLLLLARADITTRNRARALRHEARLRTLEARIREVEERDRMRQWRPPIDGHEIMALLNLKPGPAVGRIKRAIEEAILEGIIPNEHDAAVAYMMQIKDQILSESAAESHARS
jgi:poly(A) polymerase